MAYFFLFISAGLLFFPILTVAQNNNITREAILYQGDTVVYSNIFVQNPKIKTIENLFYFWHRHDSLSSTQGGWSGKLLHGKVEFFAPKKTLVKQGAFENGLKNGLWQEWYSNGFIKRKEHWKKGVLIGFCLDYDTEGKLTTRTTFRKGKQKGKLEYDKNGKKIKKAASPKQKKPKVDTNPTRKEPQKVPKKSGKKEDLNKNNTNTKKPTLDKNKKEPTKKNIEK